MSTATSPSMADPPFACPPDIVLDLPAPPSVNKTRRVDWLGARVAKKWVNLCDPYVLAAKCRAVDPVRFNRIKRFELTITLSEAHTNIDLDNGLKVLIDYLRRIELIEDDAKRNMRGLHVTWGVAPAGVRVTVRPVA